MSKWKKVNGVEDIGEGDWVVIMENNKKGYLFARGTGERKYRVVNGNFAFDMPKVIAYAPFPEYNLGELE